MNAQNDHYRTLGAAPDATDAEIKHRYRALMREVHPDANKDDPAANRKAARINAAYEVLGDAEKRAEYDAQHHPRSNGHNRRRYEVWAEDPNWEDIVAEHVPAKRPAHKHTPEPVIEPDEIEVSMTELRQQPRVRRTIRVTNNCACTLVGDVSTSEPWVWGPIGHFTIKPGESVAFDIEIVARKVSFPGLSRVIFVAKDWTGVVPVKITDYTPTKRRVYPATESAYVPNRRRRAVRR